MRDEVQAGRLIAVGRTRLVRPDCPYEIVRALELGGRAACLTAARLRDIWVPDDGRVHISVPNNRPLARSRLPHDLKVHWVDRVLEPPHPQAGLESVRDMLRHIALCRPLNEAVVMFDSAVRKRLIPLQELKQLGTSVGGRMLCATELTNELADSGLETLMRLGLVERGIQCRQQVVIDGRPVDFLIGEWLVVQCDGFGPHNTAAQRRRDDEQNRRLERQGYTVIRFGYAMIMDDLDGCVDEVAASMAQGSHLMPRLRRA